jgi:hypothetical protein
MISNIKIIWLCPAVKEAVGGIKVIYKQSELVNNIIQPLGHKSVVLHPNTLSFKIDWFKHNAVVENQFFKWRWTGKSSLSKIDGCFNPDKHILIIPEVWAAKFGAQLARLGIPYVIYVQNGYLINQGSKLDLIEAYSSAICILTISDDTSDCIAMAFPKSINKILRMHAAVDAQRFNPNHAKENLITYMPRKLGDHASKVLFFLHSHLPAHWRVQAINGLNEEGVAELLQRSKIFMSFSHFEGFGLPPLEAALCGNHVIGYTGQGAKEYWTPEIFDSVEPGNVVGFAKLVLSKVSNLDTTANFINKEKIKNLADTYSSKKEYSDITDLLKKIGLL